MRSSTLSGILVTEADTKSPVVQAYRGFLRNNFGMLMISHEHLAGIVDLPFHHRDPFDAAAGSKHLLFVEKDDSRQTLLLGDLAKIVG